MANIDRLHYEGTEKGRRIDKLQTKIQEQMVSSCTILDLGHAIMTCSDEVADEIEFCFHHSRSIEFYQLILNLMYERFKEQAIDSALRIGEHEY